MVAELVTELSFRTEQTIQTKARKSTLKGKLHHLLNPRDEDRNTLFNVQNKLDKKKINVIFLW